MFRRGSRGGRAGMGAGGRGRHSPEPQPLRPRPGARPGLGTRPALTGERLLGPFSDTMPASRSPPLSASYLSDDRPERASDGKCASN